MKLNVTSLRKHFVLALTGAVLALTSSLGLAGRTCDAKPQTLEATEQAGRIAAQVIGVLEERSVDTALIGRVGSDQSSRGVRYTHVGFVQRNHPNGRWTVTHVLNHCGSSTSDIFDEGLGSFFMDDPFAFEAKVVIPSPYWQGELRGALAGHLKRALHQPSYSVIANPWSTAYQNSNNWAAELMAAAFTGPREPKDRRWAQQWLKQADFKPSVIPIGPMERAGSRLTVANMRFGDHPDTAWQTQRYEVATGDAVLDWLMRFDASAEVWRISPQSRHALRATLRETTSPAPEVSAPSPNSTPTPVAAQALEATRSTVSSDNSRAQIFAGTQSLLQGYACREQGYLRQCQRLSASRCEDMLKTAINACFAPISDSELTLAQRQSALAVVERIGLCAVQAIDAELGARSKPAYAPNGQSCNDFRVYK